MQLHIRDREIKYIFAHANRDVTYSPIMNDRHFLVTISTKHHYNTYILHIFENDVLPNSPKSYTIPETYLHVPLTF